MSIFPTTSGARLKGEIQGERLGEVKTVYRDSPVFFPPIEVGWQVQPLEGTVNRLVRFTDDCSRAQAQVPGYREAGSRRFH